MPKKTKATDPIDPLERLKELLAYIVQLLLTSFQNVIVLVLGGVLVVLALLYIFFSLFGLT